MLKPDVVALMEEIRQLHIDIVQSNSSSEFGRLQGLLCHKALMLVIHLESYDTLSDEVVSFDIASKAQLKPVLVIPVGYGGRRSAQVGRGIYRQSWAIRVWYPEFYQP